MPVNEGPTAVSAEEFWLNVVISLRRDGDLVTFASNRSFYYACSGHLVVERARMLNVVHPLDGARGLQAASR